MTEVETRTITTIESESDEGKDGDRHCLGQWNHRISIFLFKCIEYDEEFLAKKSEELINFYLIC